VATIGSLVYLNPRIRQDLILESYCNATDPTFIAQKRGAGCDLPRRVFGLGKRHGITPQTTKTSARMSVRRRRVSQGRAMTGIHVVGSSQHVARGAGACLYWH